MTHFLFDLRLFSRAIRPGFSSSSRSSRFRSFSAFFILIVTMVATAQTAIASTTIQTTTSAIPVVDVGGCIVYPPELLAALIFASSLLALVVFHLVMVPLQDFVVRRFTADRGDA